jgi:hypothetical protein
MTEFDGSSSGPNNATTYATDNVPAAEAMRFGPALDDSPASMLDVLRDRVEQRDVADADPWVHEIPKVGVRLVCDPRIDNADYQRWVKAAMAKTRTARRGRSNANAMDLDQLALSARAITATNIRVEIKRQGDEWVAISDGASADALNLEDAAMLRAFGVMDPTSLLRKLFGRDAAVINAGQELLAAAGYLDGDDEDDDPI